jgi:hypothetical protein
MDATNAHPQSHQSDPKFISQSHQGDAQSRYGATGGSQEGPCCPIATFMALWWDCGAPQIHFTVPSERHSTVCHTLCVLSDTQTTAPCRTLPRRSVQSSTLALRLSMSSLPTRLIGPMPSTEPSQGIGWGASRLFAGDLLDIRRALRSPRVQDPRFIDHDRVVDVVIQQQHMLQLYRTQESRPPTNLKGHSDDDG